MLEFRTLGEISLRKSRDDPLDAVIVQPKLVALLAYLVVAHPRGFHRRDTLLGLLWPEQDEAHARGALRQALHGLRRALGEHMVVTSGDTDVGIDRDHLWCDACTFEQALEGGQLRRAVSLYCGSFLRGFFLTGAPNFVAWVDSMRDRLEREYAASLEQLAHEALEQGNTLRAVEWWRQLWDVDPYNGRVAVGLMGALDAAGERCAAIRVAERHADLLKRVFDADPDPEVVAFAEQIRRPGHGGAPGQ
jgi:serine/threonine-protein kinase